MKLSTEEIVLGCSLSLNNNERNILYTVRNMYEGYNIRRDIKLEISTGEIKKFLFIYLFPYSLSNPNELGTTVITYVNETYPELDFKMELIQISEIEVRQLIEKDYSFIELTISNLKEKFLSLQSEHNQSIKIDDPMNYEENEDEIEDIEEVDEKIIIQLKKNQ